MKILVSLLLVAFCTTVLSQNSSDTTTKESTSSQSSTASTTVVTTVPTTKSTEEPAITTEKPVITTEKPVITTEEPVKTTSTEPSTTTSTPTNSSSTTEQPVTTVAPPPDKCDWNVTEGDITCIRAEMKAQFIIVSEDKKFYKNLGCNATLLNHDCSSNTTQTLVLFEKDDYSLTMVFERESDKVSVKNVTLEYTLPNGEKGTASNDADKLFTVKVGNSYLCRSETKINLGNVTMEISELHIQAFAEKDFGTAEECDADDKVSDIVPIAVGVALASLIIIVLIAYLVGRRRSRQRGYQSV